MYGIGRLAARAFDFKATRAIGEQFVAADATDFHAASFIPVKSTALDRAAALGLQVTLRAGVAVFLASRRRRLLLAAVPRVPCRIWRQQNNRRTGATEPQLYAAARALSAMLFPHFAFVEISCTPIFCRSPVHFCAHKISHPSKFDYHLV